MTAVDTMRRLLAATLTDMADFDAVTHEALDSLPSDLREQMSNVDIVVEGDPPPGQRLLDLYQGVPLTRRGSNYAGALPDGITIYRRPLERLYGHDPALLERQIGRGASGCTRSRISSESTTSG